MSSAPAPLDGSRARHRQWGERSLFAWAADLARRADAEGPRHGAFVERAGTEYYFKGSCFPRHAGWRHAFRSGLLRFDLPRRAEHKNLEWLSAHGFRAPRPVVSGAWWSGPRPRYQYLLTERVPDAVGMPEALARRTSAERLELVADLGRRVAELHALGFVHRDLYPRNLLVAGDADPEWIWLDAWRGGVRFQLRGRGYDLACLTGDAALAADERHRFLASYEQARRSARSSRG